jgi:hypothetical protein
LLHPHRYLIEQLNKLGLAYVHMVEDRYQNFELADAPFSARSLDPFRKVGTDAQLLWVCQFKFSIGSHDEITAKAMRSAGAACLRQGYA